MPAPPTKKDGKLWAKLHILDTPCGRILKTLCDYGYKIGISSRGTGDVYDDGDGEMVDPDTYQLNAFDAVIIPAVKEARLEMVMESLKPKISLRAALNESLEKANESDRKIMEETLDSLKLDEALVLPDEADIENVKRLLKENGLEIDTKNGEEWIDIRPRSVHIQVVSRDDKSLEEVAEALTKISEEIYNEETGEGIPMTYSADSVVTAGVDLWKKHVDEVSTNESLGRPLSEGFNPRMRLWEVIDECIDEIKRQADGDPDPDDIGDFLQGAISHCRELADDYGVYVESISTSKGCTINEAEGEEVQKTDSVGNTKPEEEEEEEDITAVITEFKEALLNAQKLEKDNLSLQEQLSVCNAKEKSLEEELANYKSAIIGLSDKAKEVKPLKAKADKAIEESLSKDKIIKSKECKLQLLSRRKARMTEQLDKVKGNVEDLQKQVSSLTEELTKNKAKLNTMSKTVNQYKTELTEAKQELITSKATAYGISEKELTKKLGESYKVKEIDSICEDLRNYKSQVSKLPFRVSPDTKMSIKPSKDEISTTKSRPDDDISSLLQFLQ